ncbi:MAG TPA: hypothetical protein VKA48_10645, partial [Gammaproteobacteria bacterium]|nr:hypothetical protein [Gammaproteobacteria bacterium]
IASSLPFSRASWEARQTAARLQEGAKRYGAALTQLGPLLGQGRPPERKRLRKEVDRLLPKAIRAELQDDNPFEGYKLFNRYAGKHPPPQAGRYAFRSLLELGALKAAHRVLDRFRGTYGETIRGKRWEYELARAYRQLGDPAGLDWIDALLDKQPAHPWASRLRLEKARLLKGLGRNGKLLRYLDAHPGLPAQPAGKLRAEALKAEKKPQQAYRALVRLDRGSGSEGLSGPLNAEAGDLAARIGKIYEARDYWKKALKAGVPDWQARQLRALLGVDALQREDFAGAREYLKGVKGDGPFARTAAIYSDLMPLIREQLH